MGAVEALERDSPPSEPQVPPSWIDRSMNELVLVRFSHPFGSCLLVV